MHHKHLEDIFEVNSVQSTILKTKHLSLVVTFWIFQKLSYQHGHNTIQNMA